MMKKILLFIFISIVAVSLSYGQKHYKASFFGCVSDGITNNTASIQFAINYISENGGGQLDFYVGRYLTGGIKLKSNVTIKLHEGAILVASPNVNDYPLYGDERALLYGENIKNLCIIGKGVIEAEPAKYVKMLNHLRSGNRLKANYLNNTPSLLTFKNCTNIRIDGILFQKAPKVVQKFINCTNVELDSVTLLRNRIDNGGLMIFQNTKEISLSNFYIETNGQAIIMDDKSEITSIEDCITSDGKPVL